MQLAETVSLEQAAQIFLEQLERYRPRIEKSRRKISAVYGHQTPESPYLEFDLKMDGRFTPPRWADSANKRQLAKSMFSILERLALLPQFDYIPCIGIPGISDSGYIARLYGSDCQATAEGGLVVKRPAIPTAEEVDTLAEPDLSRDPILLQMREFVSMTVQALNGEVEMTYPQLQGPATNSFRILPQEEGLMSTMTNPEEMARLGMLTAKTSVDILHTLFREAGGMDYFRPRTRFCQPKHIKGLFVDDWISTISPDAYREIYQDCFAYMEEQVGAIYFHTCGPVLHLVELLSDMPGVCAFEVCFINGQSKTVEDLFTLKKKAADRLMVGSFGNPFGQAVYDEENLSGQVLEELSANGGFAMQAFGSMEDALRLSRRLF